MIREKIFFDTEFTGLHKNTTLVSIGLIRQNGRSFYAELTDYDQGQVDEWLQENIIDKLTLHDMEPNTVKIDMKGNTYFKGTKEGLAIYLGEWLENIGHVEMWSDCLAYDWVLFNDLYGTAFNIPENVYYIPMDLCTLLKVNDKDPDINREEFAKVEGIPSRNKHNALWDAYVIRECYNKLMPEPEGNKE